MKIEERILRSISMRKEKIILRSDVSRFGSASSVSNALSGLIKKGKIVRIGSGIYAKARINKYTNTPTPDGVFEDLAVESLNKLGFSVKLGEPVNIYNNGCTQVPATISFNVNKATSRKIQFADQKVVYEKSD